MAMQGDREIIRLLNTVLTNELTAVNQFWLHVITQGVCRRATVLRP